MGEGLKRHVEGRPRVVHRTADQGLHRNVAAARVNQADIEAFVGEMAARSRDLVRDDAEELAAEREQHLAALAVGIFLGDEQDAGHAGQSLQSRSSTDDFFITAIFELASEFRRQILAAIHSGLRSQRNVQKDEGVVNISHSTAETNREALARKQRE